MSSITIATLSRMSCETLASILASPAASNLAIVDVRDSGPFPPLRTHLVFSAYVLPDHVGGHIRSSLWVPGSQLDYRTPELVHQLQHKAQVVFHCMLSQQRGPNAALRYAREQRRLLGEEASQHQEVFVLDGGFATWQAKYGEDGALTEAYVRDIWLD